MYDPFNMLYQLFPFFYQLAARPAGPKITLRFPRLLVYSGTSLKGLSELRTQYKKSPY